MAATQYAGRWSATSIWCGWGIRSERQLVERIEFDLLFRWFVGIGVNDADGRVTIGRTSVTCVDGTWHVQ